MRYLAVLGKYSRAYVSGQDLAILEVITNPIYDCLLSNSGVEISRCVSLSIARTVHCVLGKAVRLVVS